jgi:hypothetical protein
MHEDEPNPKDKRELIEKIRASQSLINQTIAALTHAQQAGPNTAEDWTVKDHLAHLGRWAQGMSALLRKEPRYPAMGLDEAFAFSHDHDEFNAAIYEQMRYLTPLEARAVFNASFDDIIATINAIDFSALFQTYSHFQPHEPGKDSGDPIIGWVISNTYHHCGEHLPWIQERIQRDAARIL